MLKKTLLILYSFVILTSLIAQNLPNPIIFCTQVPNPSGFGTSMETFGNHQASIYSAPRGGDLYIRYPNGNLKNLTQSAGYGQTGMQLANAIAVRDPHVHWSGQKVLFSMVVGAPIQRYQVTTHYWQLYEITGLGENQTPVITKVPNQPTNFNNIMPIYGTDERIIFVSDRPRSGETHLYPQLDEYETAPIVSGIWRINPNACSAAAGLEMLTHSPSGDFSPILDRKGRIVFTRWDHLQRDQQADADIMSNTGYGMFNYADESATASKSALLPDIEVFPEPRSSRTDLLSLPEWANTNGQTFNIFNPWMINEDGTELETVNHVGRHEMGGNYFDRNFNNDPNLTYYSSTAANTPDTILRSIFHIQESPITEGLYFGTESGEFGSHASGMIVSMFAPQGVHPEQIKFKYITHPATRSPTSNPTSSHSGLYRNPMPLSNGKLLAMHTTETDYDQNIGTSTTPLSKYNYRIKTLKKVGNYMLADSVITGNGITKNVSWWSPDELRTYNGVLWESYPVELKARAKPANPTFNTPIPSIEKAIFTQTGVNEQDFKKFLKRNNISLLVTRDVTSRDDADIQQPFNLKVAGTNKQTLNPSKPGIIYNVKYMQYLQADQLRGMGGMTNPRAGRRPIAKFLHDANAMAYNMPTTGTTGSVNIQSDGSVAVFVPANRAITWQLTDANNKGIVRERLWLSTVPGEVRVCSSCHGESTLNQAGLTSPTNSPLAMTAILNHVKVLDRDNDGVKDIYDAFPLDPTQSLMKPLSEDFVAGIANWVNQNPDNDAVTWANQSGLTCNSSAAMINNLAANASGKLDRLIKVVDLTNMDAASLSFDVAYARYSATRFDKLKVYINTCDGNEFLVYEKGGSNLATAPDQTTSFTPSACSQWRTELVNLNPYAGKQVKLIFENENGYGNRLFLDNINILEQDIGYPLPTKVVLQSSYDVNTGLMSDDLKTILPLQEPYSGRPSFTHINGGGNETINATVLNVTGNNAISDWMFIELRSKNNPLTVLATRSALLQRDGDLVDIDGVNPLRFKIASDSFYLGVRHRNHLGFRTLNKIALNNFTTFTNLSNNSVPLFGASPLTALSQNVSAMSSGDANSDGSIDAFDTILWEAQNGLFDDYSKNSDYNLDASVDAFDSILWELNNGKFEEF